MKELEADRKGPTTLAQSRDEPFGPSPSRPGETWKGPFGWDLRSRIVGLIDSLIYWTFYHLAWIYFRVLAKGRVSGTLPQGPFILAANHVSYLDGPILNVETTRRFGRGLRFIAKDVLLENPLFRSALRRADAIMIPEGGMTRSGVRKILETLRGGGVIAIFPEGTRSPTGKLLPGQKGVSWLLRRTGVPVVPVGITGFYENWPAHRRLPRLFPKPMTIRIGSPITFSPAPHGETTDRDADERMVARLMGEIAKLVNATGG